MRRFAVPGVISLVVVGLLALLAYGVAHKGPTNQLASRVWRGEKPVAPNADVRLQLMGSGQRSSLNDLRGKVVLVNVFAGWCVACQDEVSQLKHAQQVLGQHGGEVVGVTYQDSSSDARGYMQRYGLKFPVLLDPGDSWIQPYGVNGVPETFVISRTGRVLAANTGQMTSKWLNHALTRVLGAQT